MSKKKDKLVRLDSFMSSITSLGVAGKDKKTSLTFAVGADEWLFREKLEALYYADGMAAKIVDLLPYEMLRKGFKVNIADSKDLEEAIAGKFRALRLDTHLGKVLRESRLYGGAALILGVEDGRDPSEPIDKGNIRRVRFVSVLNRHQLVPLNINRDPLSSRYGTPERFRVSGEFVGGQRQGLEVHPSRVIVFKGAEIPDRVEQIYEIDGYVGWGSSILQRAYAPLRNLISSYDNIGTMIQEYNQSVIQIAGLNQMLAEGDDDLIRSRLRLMQYSRSIVNMLVLQDGENFDNKAIDIRGLAEIIDRLATHVSAVTNIPVTKLMGETPGGMNSTGDYDDKNWLDFVATQQESALREPLEEITELCLLAKDSPTGGALPEQWALDFEPLYELDELEQSNLRKQQAETDSLYFQMGVLFPEEIAESRFGGAHYSTDTNLDDELRRFVDPTPTDFSQPDIGPGDIDTPESPEGLDIPEQSGVMQGELENVQKTALNGAQVTSLQELTLSVAQREMPLESAVELVTIAFPVSREQARRLMAPAASFTPKSVESVPENAATGDAVLPTPSGGLEVDETGTLRTPEGGLEVTEDEHRDPILEEGESLKSPKEIGESLGVKGGSIIRLFKKGLIGGALINGRYRFSESEVRKAVRIPQEPGSADSEHSSGEDGEESGE